MSDAVAQNRVSKTVGYKILKGDFRLSSPNLPQRIAIIGEANNANQSELSTDAQTITSAQQAGTLFGYGSPLHMIARILLPRNNAGVGGIPIIAYPQPEAAGATSKIIKLVVSGTATANGIHTIVIGGRYGVDGTNYDISITEGDGATEINAKIENAINNVLGSPVIADDYGYQTMLETKWKGLTANDLVVSVETYGKDLGLSYVVTNYQAGTGTPTADVVTSLESFGNAWNTLVINSYGTVEAVMAALEAFNGVADPDTPTGRFTGIIMKPFIALTGSVAEDPSSITDTRPNEMTIAICPAPLSSGFPFEAAANVCVLQALVAQNTPHLDISGKSYPDMPAPSAIGAMSDYENRDLIVQKGCSTVDLIADKYVMMDFVTTYNKQGENPPAFRYVRTLTIDFNVRYGYYLLEQANVVDHAIDADDADVDAEKVIKPKQWKQIIGRYAVDLTNRALISDAAFMQESITVELGASNPDRLETTFKYERTGFARISATEATAGFTYTSN